MASSDALDNVVGQVVATLPDGTVYRQVLLGNSTEGEEHDTPDGGKWVLVHEGVVDGAVVRNPFTVHWKGSAASVEPKGPLTETNINEALKRVVADPARRTTVADGFQKDFVGTVKQLFTVTDHENDVLTQTLLEKPDAISLLGHLVAASLNVGEAPEVTVVQESARGIAARAASPRRTVSVSANLNGQFLLPATWTLSFG